MASACGVSWSGKSGGKLEESGIPDPPDHKSHYLNAAETKGDSSFPVVDGDGNLRSGNVNSAWDLRGSGEGVSEECLRKLDNAFEDNVLPESAYEDSVSFATHMPEWQPGMMVRWRGLDGTGQIVHVPEDQQILMVDVMEKEEGEWQSTGYTLTAGYQDVLPLDRGMRSEMSEFSGLVSLREPASEFRQLTQEAVADGFNKYGVRENEDGSIDVRFVAMEPGKRKGAEVTEEFLQKAAQKQYGRLPLQMDHSESQRANVGYVDSSGIKFSGGVLRAEVHIPDTGSDFRQDVIADFTHEPPQITDISPGFDPRSIETERAGGDVRFVDGRLREFSLTPFPAGYDEGGITPEFSEMLEDCECGDDDSSEATSQLQTRPHYLKKTQL